MKLLRPHTRWNAGNTLLLTLVISGLVGFVLIAYLNLVRAQNMSTMRSQAWNAAVPVIEAGLEDGLEHLKTHAGSTLACDGWSFDGTAYHITRRVGENYYTATITNYFPGITTNAPVIESRGYVILPTLTACGPSGAMLATVTLSLGAHQYLGRGVRVHTLQERLFVKGLVARDTIDLNGNNIMADSFDSMNGSFSSGGLYDPLKKKANGDVATNSSLTNSLNVGNADIYGHVATGPRGSVAIGPQGTVGDLAWHAANRKGIQPGFYKDDMNVKFPDVVQPFSGGAFTPSGGNITNSDGTVTYYNQILGDGNYQVTDLTGKTYVRGDAVLLVTGSINMAGLDVLVVGTSNTLQLFMAGTTADLGGNGVINGSGNATNFAYYGMPANTSLSISGNGEIVGTVYAPNAHLQLNGGGKTTTDFIGAAIAKTAKLNGHFNFHYDEALRNYGPTRGYIITDWEEMTPAEVNWTYTTTETDTSTTY